jgi:hypothetical protein
MNIKNPVMLLSLMAGFFHPASKDVAGCDLIVVVS